MKCRLGFVSNSSSSSFIVTKDLTNIGISCLKLTEAQISKINGHKNLDGQIICVRDGVKDLWLTQFLSDCGRAYDEIDKVEHICYCEGCLNEEPRDESLFNEYPMGCGSSVYILKHHDNSEQMSINQFIKRYKKDQLPQDVIVTFEPDGVRLKYVW